MGKDSKIEWTHHTFNPWWGCVKVSPGCTNCYAEAFSKRVGQGVWGKDAPRRFFGDKHWAEPLNWNAAAGRYPDECTKCGARLCMDAQVQIGNKTCPSERDENGEFDPTLPMCGGKVARNVSPRVFCASMADVFEDRKDLIPHRDRLFRLIRSTPNLTWLLLTKRPENIERLSANWLFPENLWLGTSAENQEWWDKRVPILMRIPVATHFVSAEPLLGPIHDMLDDRLPEWIIVGGESGPRAREMKPIWVRQIHDQCRGKTAFFFKQWGGRDKKAAGRELDGRTWDEIPSAA